MNVWPEERGGHAQAYKDELRQRTRQRQFETMRAFVDRLVHNAQTKGEPPLRIVFAGDMNVWPEEIANMEQTLGSQRPRLDSTGFWLKLHRPQTTSADVFHNDYLFHDAEEVAL